MKSVLKSGNYSFRHTIGLILGVIIAILALVLVGCTEGDQVRLALGSELDSSSFSEIIDFF